MEDQSQKASRELKIRQLQVKIRNPEYLKKAVHTLAWNILREYYLRMR